MDGSLFSLGNERLAENTDSYLRDKFAKAKPKGKADGKLRQGPSRRAAPESRSKRLVGAVTEDLDAAERDLLGLPPKRGSLTADEAPKAEELEPLEPLEPLDAGPAVRLAVPGAQLSSKRLCPEGHLLCCYAVAKSAALCDNCDLMQGPGEVVFGCSTCDSELCAKCAFVTATTTEESDESLELIARVTQLFSGQSSTRFVATPNGAVLDTSGPQMPQSLPTSKVEGSNRRKIANEVDESNWKQRPEGSEGYSARSVPSVPRRDVLGQFLEEQERLIQARHLNRHEGFHPSFVSTPSAPSAPRAQHHGTDEATNLMDENAAKERPSWVGDHESRGSVEPLERTFDLTLTLTGDFVDELARGYSQPWFQELLQRCSDESADRETFLRRLQDIAFEVQRPILENWGFEGNEQGLYDMTSILLQHSKEAPAWLQEKIDNCLFLLYGAGQDGIVAREAAAMAQR